MSSERGVRMTDKQIIIDGVDVAKCRCFTSEWDFNNCGHICKGTECKYKRLWYKKQLKRKEQKLEQITNMLFTGQCCNCEGYSPNCSNKELCNFKHNIKNIIDEVE